MNNEWFYRREQVERLGPVSDNEIRALLDSGELRPEHEVWAHGMPDWKPLSHLPQFVAPAAVTASNGTLPATDKRPLPDGLLGWMTLMGILNIVGGALGVLTCIGLPTGVLTIVAGVALLGARSSLAQVGSVDVSVLPFLRKLKLFMLMHGIIFLLGLLVAIVIIVIYFGAIMAALLGALGQQ